MNTSEKISRPKITVFLPCHSLEDLSDWLENDDASAILNAWTIAWHPYVLCESDGMPSWASVDLPWTDEEEVIGIVPEGLLERFTAGASPPFGTHQNFLHQDDSETFLPDLLALFRNENSTSPQANARQETLSTWQLAFVDDFRSLGLTALLFERLASRMRSDTLLEQTGFPEAVVAAAKAWREDQSAVAKEKLAEAFQCLESARDHFYPVECWCLDLVLFSGNTTATLEQELQSPVPFTLLADTETMNSFQGMSGNISNAIRSRVADGSMSLVGSVPSKFPFSLLSPEQIERDVAAGKAVCESASGVIPKIFGCYAGPRASVMLPILKRLGYQGVLWSSFDGFPMRSAGASRFQWEDESRDRIEAFEPKVVDARSSAAVLSLSSILSDAMDHEHIVLTMFCHHAGTASPWFTLLRRAATWTNVFGRFCTAESLLSETVDLSTPVEFERDGFRVGLAPDTKVQNTVVERKYEKTTTISQSEMIAVESRWLVANQIRYRDLISEFCTQEESFPDRPKKQLSANSSQGWGEKFLGSWLTKRQNPIDELTLSTDGFAVRVHGQTGGIVSVRSRKDERNRLTQQLALRWIDPGSHPADIKYSAMAADSVDRCGDGIESHGKLVHENGSVLARFSQKIQLVLDGTAVSLSIDIEPTQEAHSLVPHSGDAFGRFFACRFAWNENDFCDIFRTIQTQLVQTERQHIFSPRLVAIVSDGAVIDQQSRNQKESTRSSSLQIFTGCYPWHVQSSSHTLDTVLTTDCTSQPKSFHLALGIDLPHVIDSGIGWAAEQSLQVPPMPLKLPPNIRLVFAATLKDDVLGEGIRLRLLESCGHESHIKLNFNREVSHVRQGGEVHGPRSTQARSTQDRTPEIDGKAVDCLIHRYEMADLEIIFREDHHT
ncbi:MAG: hypothetical protein HN985_05390 [Planctomycetaceae bacterium]|nr:hypothetical protein [Planctomycetaceae bacterium]